METDFTIIKLIYSILSYNYHLSIDSDKVIFQMVIKFQFKFNIMHFDIILIQILFLC